MERPTLRGIFPIDLRAGGSEPRESTKALGERYVLTHRLEPTIGGCVGLAVGASGAGGAISKARSQLEEVEEIGQLGRVFRVKMYRVRAAKHYTQAKIIAK